MSEKRLPKYDPNVGFPKVLRGLLGEDEERGEYTRLAEAVGVTRAAISNYASGFSAASMDVCIAIAKYYEVSLDYLMGLSDVKTAKTGVRAISEYTGLSAGSVEVLKRYKDGSSNERMTISFLNRALSIAGSREKPVLDMQSDFEEVEKEAERLQKGDYSGYSIFEEMERFVLSENIPDETITFGENEFSKKVLYQGSLLRQIEKQLRAMSKRVQ